MGKPIIVFNHTNNSIAVDEEGHSVAPSDWAIADQAFVKEHLADKRLSKVNPDDITSQSNPAATMVKQRYEELVPPEPEESAKPVDTKAEAKEDAEHSTKTTKKQQR